MSAAPLRRPEDLRAAVAKASPEYTQKLEAQVKVLADRLALAMAVFADCEIDFDLEREADEDRNEWRELQAIILGADDVSQAERSRRRKLVFYEQSLSSIRQWLSRSLKAKEKQAA